MQTKILIILCSALFHFVTLAAAPDDINNNQRAWYDAVDVNANNDYTDNPNNNANISTWNDKSGSNNHVSATGNRRPRYRHNTIAIQRHGIDFDGINDSLSRNIDIWLGAVNQAEIFLLITTDAVQASSIFSSSDNNTNRLSAHTPWSNNRTYFDQGNCCGSPTRISGNIPITLNQQYFWHFIGLPALQSVVQDGQIHLTDGGSSTYNSTVNSSFALAGWAKNINAHIHNGRFFEGIFYQTGLNNAQRRIISSYLSAKWNKAFSASPSYADVYNGDAASNGNYDYFMGGIGQDNGTQTTGTSQGLTITNDNFLTANGKFITAGVNYLVTVPQTGTSTNDLPIGYTNRSNRSWYIDTTGTGGLANLSFNASTIGIPIDNGKTYSLLHRTGTSGIFTEVATSTMAGGVVSFSHLPADGIYTLGKKGTVAFSLQKTSLTAEDPLNNATNPKAIPGAFVDYTLTIKNTGDGTPDAESSIISDTIPVKLTLFTGDLDGNGSPFVFTDNHCPPTSTTLTSNLTLDYPADVIFKDAAGATISPASDFDTAIRGFEITLSGTMNASSGGNTPCFTLKYRTQIQ
jgi:hypothetical protein